MIRKLPSAKAPGHDQIPNTALKHLPKKGNHAIEKNIHSMLPPLIFSWKMEKWFNSRDIETEKELHKTGNL